MSSVAYLSIGAMFKNESHIIKEWINHYLLHGVDHFYLIDDGSTDDSVKILQPYIEKGLITLYDSSKEPRYRGRQGPIYDKYLLQHRNDTEWMEIFDLDEFLYSHTKMNIKDSLKSLKSLPQQITIRGKYFGSSKHIRQPDSVVQGFTKRRDNINDGPKSIVRMSHVLQFRVHDHVINGSSNEYSDLCYNHYQLQSREQFLRRIKNSDADDWQVKTGEYFDLHDDNTKEDWELSKQNLN
jgi:hypothetical protein